MRPTRLAALVPPIAALALAAPAHGAGPVSGATYASAPGAATSIFFDTSLDGRRVYHVSGTVPTTCGDDEPATLSGFSDYDVLTHRVSAPGFELGVGPESDGQVSASFGTGGTLMGSVSYADRGGCGGSGDFTATAHRRRGMTARRVFTLAGGYGARRSSRTATSAAVNAVAAFDLPGGAIGIADATPSKKPHAKGSLRRIDRNGAITTLARLRGTPTDAARLKDGSIAVALAGNCVVRRLPSGKVVRAAGTCGSKTSSVINPQWVAAEAGGGFVFSAGREKAARVFRASKNGAVTPLATLGEVNGLAVDRGGRVLASTTGRIVAVMMGAAPVTVAGTGTDGFGADGGLATQTPVSPGAVAALPRGGFLFAADGRVRRVSAAGRLSTFAGAGEVDTGATGADALFNPGALDVLRDGTVVGASVDDGVRFVAPARTGRLAVGLPARRDQYMARLTKRRALPVVLTRAARVTLTVVSGRRIRFTHRYRVPRGRSVLAIPRGAKVSTKGTPRMSLRATAGRSVATTRIELYRQEQ